MTMLASLGEGAQIPGASVVPIEGQAVVSPELEVLLQLNPSLNSLFPYEVVGTVQDEALSSPDELFAWVGAAREDLRSGGLALGGFGTDLEPEIDIAASNLKFVQLAFVSIAGIPLLVYFAVCARLSSSSRDRRLAALRLLGMTKKEAQRVNAVEVTAAAILGAGLGAVIHKGAQGLLGSVGLGRLIWFPEDSELPIPILMLVVMSVCLLAMVVARIGSRRAVSSALEVRRETGRSQPARFSLLPLLLGTFLLLLVLAMTYSLPLGTSLGTGWVWVMLAGLILTGVGLFWGFGYLTVTISAFIASRTQSLWMLLGTRRLQFDHSSASRVVAGFVVVVFSMGFMTGLQRDARASAVPQGRFLQYALSGQDLEGAGTAELRDLPGLRGLAVQMSSEEANKTPMIALFTSCAHIEVFLEQSLRNCSESSTLRVQADEGAEIKPLLKAGTVLRLRTQSGSEPLDIPVPKGKLRLSSDQIFSLGIPDLIVPLSALPSNLPRDALAYLASERDDESVSEFVASVAARFPSADLRYLNDNLLARRHAETFEDLLLGALMLGAVVALAAFIVASIDRALERRANLASLVVVGTDHHILIRAQAVQVVLPLSVGIILAISLGKLAEQVTVGVGGYTRDWTWFGPAIGLIFGLASILLCVLVTTPRRASYVDASLLRRE
jgi:hypothetical protein